MVASLAPGEHELDLVVTAKRRVARDAVQLELRDAQGAELPAWTPGAHVDVVLGDDVVRQYSLAGSPNDRCVWKLGVLRVADGRGGSILIHDSLVPGAKVRLRGPRNHFELVKSPRYIFLAGGIGITPISPMVAAAQAAGADWSLHYGGRSRDSMVFADSLVAAYPDNVTLWPEDQCGLLDLPSLVGAPQPDTKVYCCGPEGLLRATEQLCAQWPSGSLHVERFSPKEVAPTKTAAFHVRLERSGISVEVPPGTSIMEALREAGVDVPSSCEEGICGTCETGVLGGAPEHRDSVLTIEEQTMSHTMMICVSRGLTDLVLDL
ncbi:PDR/VanB family oxidoreductase [Pseudonocardia sp. GCM10023141]|uniref:PDR/VanB family oxidoreductase n=1 Tax=Pseudonocardia sp. GCM10023141 TaxID=3252653 RepID=UPI0036124CA5